MKDRIKFESEIIDTQPMRRVVLLLPQAKATALADVLNDEITWDDTAVEPELSALYNALKYGG